MSANEELKARARRVAVSANDAYLRATSSGMPGAVIAGAIAEFGQSEYERGKREAAEVILKRIPDLHEFECGHGVLMTHKCRDCGAGAIAKLPRGKQS